MPGKSTISISFRLDGDDKGFKDLAKSAEGLRQAMSSSVSVADQLSGRMINFAAVATGVNAASKAFGQLSGMLKGLTDAYAAQESAETRLAQVMTRRMGAAQDEIDSIKELAAEQQKLGVVSDEVQLAGAQQMSTFLSTSDSVRTLLPAMNDLIAQQDGLNASMGGAESVAKAMGKAMEGQVGSLQRLGITFTDAQAKVMQFGTEEERAAMLSAVIENSVGGMNVALAQTDSGKQQQLANTLGDIREKIGGLAQGAMPFVTIAAQAAQAASGVTTLVTGFKTLTTTMAASTAVMVRNTAQMVAQKTAALAVSVAQKTASAATKAWSAVQAVFNGILSANPIGVVVMAISALVAAVAAAYNRCDKFREVCDKIWTAVKNVASAVWDSLVKAFDAVTGAIRKAWEWLQKFLGKNKVEVEVDATDNTGNTGNADTTGLEKKYANYSVPSAGAEKTLKVFREYPATIGEVNDNLAILRQRLESATTDEARAEANALIESYTALKDEMEGAGKSVEDNSVKWHENALSLAQVNDNLAILRERFENAVTQEARASIQEQILSFENLKEEMESAGAEVGDTSKKWNAYAVSLRDVQTNIDILNALLQDTESIDEAARLNREIALWNRKADAIRNAGKEYDSTGKKAGESLRSGWQQTQNLTDGVVSLNDALRENGTIWEKTTAFVNAFLKIFDGISAVIDIIKGLTSATEAQGAAQEAQGVIAVTNASENAAASAAQAGASVAEGVAAETAANGVATLAAAEIMEAHAAIPFVGVPLATGFTEAMMAVLASLPKLASGGIATGPALAMVGEYAGASGNPEVIAPLDRLRSMLNTDDNHYGQVEFRIEGRTLVGVLNKMNNLNDRR